MTGAKRSKSKVKVRSIRVVRFIDGELELIISFDNNIAHTVKFKTTMDDHIDVSNFLLCLASNIKNDVELK